MYHMAFQSIYFVLMLVICSKGEGQMPTREWRIRIKGPKSYEDKIGIVGAGPAGIHMATLLKEIGFKDITVFERSCRIGGKSYTINYRGAPQEMGAVYVTPDFEDNVIKLIKKYTNDTLIDEPSGSYFSRIAPGPIPFRNWLAAKAMQTFRTNNTKLAVAKLFKDIIRYIKIHHQLFGKYEGELMPPPSRQVMYKIRGTFADFLKRNKLESLIPIFTVTHTVFGYGYLDEVAALYGLIWNTPKLMKGFMGRQRSNVASILKHGYQNLWETMARKEQLRIRFNWAIKKVIRSRRGIYLCSYYYQCQRFDFVVWTPHLDLAFRHGQFWPWFYREREIFTKLDQPGYITSTLVNSEGYKRGLSPTEYWVKNVYGKRQHLFWSARDSYSAINGYRGVLYRNNTYPTGNDDKSMRTNVCYQYGTSRTTRYTVNDILKDALKKNGVTKLGILKTITWRYFPRYSPADIQGGILWDTLKIQGKYGMWYAGASVIFESVKSVVEYNKLLVRLMEPIKKTNDEVGADTIDYMAVRVPKINAAYGDDDENYNTGVEDQTDPVVNDYPANNDHDNANNDHDNAELYD